MSSPVANRPKKKLPMEQKDTKKSYVLQPRQTDVLCGRGGMSNHHAGNEWYRRLIKSNRPLYKACPKHTKLLVAKAVVQAVEQQSGRFLDKEKQTGLWYIVDYKRAVDKTSQGLREKDRAGSESDDDDDIEEMANPPTDLNVLARQISQADPAPGGNKGKFAYEYPSQRSSTTDFSFGRKAPPYASAVANGSDDFDPLPPNMQPRETSMFRFLQSTKLLSNEPDRKLAATTSDVQEARARAHQALLAKHGDRQKRSTGEGGDAPSVTRFQSQVSDWLTSFWPVGGPEEAKKLQQQSKHKKRKAPPAPAAQEAPTELETGASQVLLQMATSSKLFRGFSSLFDEQAQAKASANDSLLDDYEESPQEKRMRKIE